LGNALAEVGRHQEAVAAADAVRRVRRLAEGDPDAHQERLARALAHSAKISLDAGHDLRTALSAVAEAEELYLILAEESRSNIAAYAPYFQTALDLHADILEPLGRTTEAGALRRLRRTGDPTEVRRMILRGR
jgi:hypothetical protein